VDLANELPKEYHSNAEYWNTNKDASNQLIPAGHEGTRDVSGRILVDPLYANTDYPIASYIAVENLEAFFTMRAVGACRSMDRKLPDDVNFARRLSKGVDNLESGTYVTMGKKEFSSNGDFMRRLLAGLDGSAGCSKKPLSLVRKKMVDDSGLADLYKNLMNDRARRRMTVSNDTFFGFGHRLVDWLQTHGYRCPSTIGETAEERELGRWIRRIRTGDLILDHRRRMFLRAINFIWTAVKGRPTIQWFPDNWEERWEELIEVEAEGEAEGETENNGETD